MHATYNFHFLDTVSEQLIAKLSSLPITQLDATALDDIGTFQLKQRARQGVYILHYGGEPVYLGKASDVRARLKKHLRKLTGRQHIDLSKVGYKALLLDKSMSTAANESLLISIFRRTHTGMWNGQGFGPNDPGKRRDTTEPSQFDKAYPIKSDWPIDFPDDSSTVGELLRSMKQQLPYTLRYDIKDRGDDPIDLRGVPREAKTMLQTVVSTLGPGWKGVTLSYGMILYQTSAKFPFGVEITP